MSISNRSELPNDKRGARGRRQREVIRSDTVMRAIGGWLFRGSRVYRLSEPDKMLKTVRINWDAQTTDVQSQDGTVFYGISWDDLDFWNPEDYHLPDGE